jgi:SAM-dependent methyltransferase
LLVSSAGPYLDISNIRRSSARLSKLPARDKNYLVAHLEDHLRFVAARGLSVPKGAKILDFGCGMGETVEILLSKGYDAWGVDVAEYWGKDRDAFWDDVPAPAPNIEARLKVVDLANYVLPYEDKSFDLCLSDQVFEHVFNHAESFREIARVLKPGAISIHHFPGPNNLREGHVFLPAPWLCRFKPYLAFWALAGARSPRQQGMSWRETLATNIETMRQCNYPTKRALQQYAREAGVTIEFAEREAFQSMRLGRMASVARTARAWNLDFAVEPMLSLFAQRYMVLTPGRIP